MRQIMVLLAVLLGWSDSTTAQTSDAEEVKATVVAMWDALKNGDLDRYASYLHPDYTSFRGYGVYLNSGKEYEVRDIVDYLKRAQGVHTDMHHPEVTVMGTVAWLTYYWTDSGYIDGARFSSRGKGTRIFVKQDGRWLVAHAHFTVVE